MMLTRGQFAMAIGASKRTVHGWDLGEHEPTERMYRRFVELRDRYGRESRRRLRDLKENGGPKNWL